MSDRDDGDASRRWSWRSACLRGAESHRRYRRRCTAGENRLAGLTHLVEWGYQPESTAAREAPTAAPSESANASTGPEFATRSPATGHHDRGLGQLWTAA